MSKVVNPLKVTPWGIRRALNWASAEYGHPDIYVTENGFSDKLGNLDDLQRWEKLLSSFVNIFFLHFFTIYRVYYYKHYTNQILKSILEDGLSVRGYYAWSLMDNFEWGNGYTEKFGLHRVNMSDPNRERTPKESAFFFGRLVRENGFVENENVCWGTQMKNNLSEQFLSQL